MSNNLFTPAKMSTERKTVIFKSKPYECTFSQLGDNGTAMSSQALLVIRKEDDKPHLPTFSGQVPLEVAEWIEKLVSENNRLKKRNEFLEQRYDDYCGGP